MQSNSLKIVEIEDSGCNGIIYKAIESGHSRALKVMYGFSVPTKYCVAKAKLEYDRTKLVEGIEGVPTAYNFYDCYDSQSRSFSPFNLKDFDIEAAKKQIMNNRGKQSTEFESASELVLSGAFTMTYMDVFSKLPRTFANMSFTMPNIFFKKLEYISDEFLKRGITLPPELDFCFDTNLEPIVLDFGNCIVLDDLILSGKGETIAKKYMQNYNSGIINKLKSYYSKPHK